jgi:predicted TPR repeat methyltransferase
MTPVLRSSGHLAADRRYDYARGAAAEGDHVAASDLLQQTLEIAPTWAPAWFALGESRQALGETAAAVDAFTQALAHDPQDSQGARLRLARLGAADQPAQPPQAYVRDLFDQYAARFETHLVKDLAYRAPSVLRDAITRAAPERRFAHVLDLGCGTGLMAKEMADLCDEIAGVDLAPAMAAKARASGLYAEVEADDLLVFLNGRTPASADLVVAADVFVYCGELDAIFGAVRRVVKEQAVFAFTLQRGAEGDYRLGEDLRYAHTPAYVARLAAAHGFALASCDEVSVRQDRGQPVPGLSVVLLAP